MADNEEEELCEEYDAGKCFPIQDGGFKFKKTFRKMNNKKLSGTIAFRLKTNVTRALLKENACDERKLQQDIEHLDHIQNKQSLSREHSKLNFTFHQRKRRESWDRDDRSSLDKFNFPIIRPGDRKLASASLNQIYRTPVNTEKKGVCVPLLPVMYGEVAPTIVEYRNSTYVAKRPSIIELNKKHQQWYDKYRGVDLLHKRTVFDSRFENLSTALSEVKSTVNSGRPVRALSEPINSLHRQQYNTNSSASLHHSNHRRALLTRAATTFM